MNEMKLILRWHGEKDPISLRQYAQIPNLYGIVTSLYHLPLGQVWDRAEVLHLKERIEAHGLRFEVVDSFRIHEDIKRGLPSRDALIERYQANIRMLAECGIKIICYNFMPVFDWTRTDLAHLLPDGSECLSFEAAMYELGGQVLGFSVLGPLAVAFCKWLHDRRAARPAGGLYFLARDMYLMREVYGLLYPEEKTEYLQVSRRSLAPAFLAVGEYACVLAALPRQRLTGAQLAAYCGTVCPEGEAESVFDLKTPDTKALYAFLAKLPRPETADAVTGYLQSRPLRTGDILVDIGSGGTTQLLLEKLLGTELHGMQLSADDRLRSRFSAARTEVFLFDGAPAPRIYWAGQPLLERLLSQDAGATLSYTKTPAGFRVNTATQPAEPLVAELQRGVLYFAQEWQKSVLNGQTIEPQRAITPFLRLVESPTALQAKLLGDLTVEDGGIYPLAAPRSMGYYLTHPAAAGRDLGTARWKIGFLKRLAPLPLPYGKIYQKLKK